MIQDKMWINMINKQLPYAPLELYILTKDLFLTYMWAMCFT